MNYRKWVVPSPNKALATELSEECGIDTFTALLLATRGMTDPMEIEAFLSDDAMLCDPFEYKDMLPAAERIRRAMNDFEKIAIYGDYDCDGVTATALLYDYLAKNGADVLYVIPSRSDGYGMNFAAIDRLKAAGVSLIITVDNGISAVEEIRHAKEIGIETVVTDHHLPGDTLPPAVALVDPHRADCPSEFKDLCGVGVAFLLVCALEGCLPEEMLEEYADLVAIGTVADVMPLIGENRVFVKAGLRAIKAHARVGVAAVLQAAGYADKPLTATSIAFTLAPRLNAAGRIGDSMRGVQLLLESDPNDAAALAAEICADNATRQQIEGDIVASAVKQIEQAHYDRDRVLVVADEGWHHGVVGIAAARLVERFGRPVIVLGIEGESATGSGRSIAGFNLFEAISSCGDHLTKFGGHPLAAGMTLPRAEIDAFRDAINEYARLHHPQMPFPQLKLDCKLNPAGVSLALADSLEPLAPFGHGNPTPLFGLYGMTIENIQPMGGGKHLRLFLSKRGAVVRCVLFGTSVEQLPFDKGDLVDAAVTLEKNLWKGDEYLRIQVKDLRPCAVNDAFLSSVRLYEQFQNGEPLSDYSPLMIDRAEAAAVFRLVRGAQGGKITVERVINRLCDRLSYAKIRVAIDVLCELSVLQLDGDTLCPGDPSIKVDLASSGILAKIQSGMRGSI